MKIQNMVGLWYQFNSFYVAMVMMQNILLRDRYGGNLSVTKYKRLESAQGNHTKKHDQ